MNAYFLYHAIETEKEQLLKSSIDPQKFQKQEIVNLAMQLSIVDLLQTISGDIRDVESKLASLPNAIK